MVKLCKTNSNFYKVHYATENCNGSSTIESEDSQQDVNFFVLLQLFIWRQLRTAIISFYNQYDKMALAYISLGLYVFVEQ